MRKHGYGRKSIISVILAVMLVMTQISTVFAAESTGVSSIKTVQVKAEEEKKEDAKKDDSKKDDSKKDDSKKDDSKKDDSKKDDSKESDSKKEDSKKDDKKDDSKKEDSKKEDSKKNDTKDDSKEGDAKKDDAKKDDNKKEESKKDESKKDDSGKDESKKDNSQKDDSKKDESKKDDDKKDENKEANNGQDQPADEKEPEKAVDHKSDDNQDVQEKQPGTEEVKAGDQDDQADETTQDTQSEKEETTEAAKKEVAANSEPDFDNSTDLADGTYKEGQFTFTFTGGTGKASLSLDKVIVENGKAYAAFTASSENMTHIYLGEPSSSDEDLSLYDPETDRKGDNVYSIKDKKATVPAAINKTVKIGVRTTAMSAPHWVSYSYKIEIDASTVADKDGDAAIADGTYKPDSFSFTGGTGKATMTCSEVTVKGGKATAVFNASSANMTHIYMGKAASNNEDPSLYDPATGKCGSNVYAISNQKVSVPVSLNTEEDCAARTTAMSEPHWINYRYKITLSPSSEKIDGSGDGGSQGGSGGSKKESSSTEPVPAESSSKGLANGTYKVKSTTCRKMFYLYPKETDPAYSILVVDGSKMTATITLTGEGYDFVYMGTPDQAKKAKKTDWVKAKVVNGYYTFTIPVSALNKKLPITPHSKRYEEDNDPSTEPWRPDKWIMFYSAGAIKVKDGVTSTAASAKKKKKTSKTDKKEDKKKDKVSKWKDDSSKSTHAVDNKTGLKDGVYKPDSFSWSGGSGRLAYIRCNKITVTGGRAFATIEFSSSHYDSLRANGKVYSKSGGGNSTFVIPVKLNANNTIIGRTTAMSQPHWIQYKIYIGKSGAGVTAKDSKEIKEEAAKAKMKLTDKAPEISGLTYQSATEIKYAKNFKIYNYDQGVKLLSIDLTSGTGLKEEYTQNAEKNIEQSESSEDVEYDDEGNPVAKSGFERIEALYHNNVVNYLLVPEGFDVPAGLDKDYIIIVTPAKKTYAGSEAALSFIKELGASDYVALLGTEDAGDKSAGNYEDPDYAAILKNKTDLAILPSKVLPKEDETEKKEMLEKLESRFTTLGVPVIVDRSEDEKEEQAKAEWIKVYGAIFGN